MDSNTVLPPTAKFKSSQIKLHIWTILSFKFIRHVSLEFGKYYYLNLLGIKGIGLIFGISTYVLYSLLSFGSDEKVTYTSLD